MAKYECKICGYVFDEQQAGESFDNLYSCPICDADKSVFNLIEEDVKEASEDDDDDFVFEEADENENDNGNEEIVEEKTEEKAEEEKTEESEYKGPFSTVSEFSSSNEKPDVEKPEGEKKETDYSSLFSTASNFSNTEEKPDVEKPEGEKKEDTDYSSLFSTASNFTNTEEKPDVEKPEGEKKEDTDYSSLFSTASNFTNTEEKPDVEKPESEKKEDTDYSSLFSTASEFNNTEEKPDVEKSENGDDTDGEYKSPFSTATEFSEADSLIKNDDSFGSYGHKDFIDEVLEENSKEEADKEENKADENENKVSEGGFVIEKRQEFWKKEDDSVKSDTEEPAKEEKTSFTFSRMGSVERVIGAEESDRKDSEDEKRDETREYEDNGLIQTFYSGKPVKTEEEIKAEEEAKSKENSEFIPLWGNGMGTVQKVVGAEKSIAEITDSSDADEAEELVFEEAPSENPNDADIEEEGVVILNFDDVEKTESETSEETSEITEAEEDKTEEATEEEKVEDTTEEASEENLETEEVEEISEENAEAEEEKTEEEATEEISEEDKSEETTEEVSEEEKTEEAAEEVSEAEEASEGFFEDAEEEKTEDVAPETEEETAEDSADAEPAETEETAEELFEETEEEKTEETAETAPEMEEETTEDSAEGFFEDAEEEKTEETAEEAVETETDETADSSETESDEKEESEAFETDAEEIKTEDKQEEDDTETEEDFVTEPSSEDADNESVENVESDASEEEQRGYICLDENEENPDGKPVAYSMLKRDTKYTVLYDTEAQKIFDDYRLIDPNISNGLENIILLPAQCNPLPLKRNAQVETKTVIGALTSCPVEVLQPFCFSKLFIWGEHIPNNSKPEKYTNQALVLVKGEEGHIPNLSSKEELREEVEIAKARFNGTPVGIDLVAGRIEDDLEACVYAKLDFVILNDVSSRILPYALRRARNYLNRVNSKLEILVCVEALKDAQELAKILALGANFVLVERGFDIDMANSMTESLREICRSTGHNNVHDLNLNDICTIDTDLALYTDISHV